MTRKKSPIADKKASVYLERNGLSIRIDDVNAADCACVAYDLLQALRLLTRTHGELVPDLNPVGGYHALDTSDHEDYDGRRRAGFRVRRG
jgi:hypothetical protein